MNFVLAAGGTGGHMVPAHALATELNRRKHGVKGKFDGTETDETAWDELKKRLAGWLSNNLSHPHHAGMKTFASAGYDRLNGNLKDIRTDLVGLMGSNKPWEVLVGQALAIDHLDSASSSTSMAAFLGDRPARTAQSRASSFRSQPWPRTCPACRST